MSEVDTVSTWGVQTSTPPISKYLIKKSGGYGIRTQYHRTLVGSLSRCTTTGYNSEYMEYSKIYHKKIKIFCTKKQKKLVILKKFSVKKFAKIA